MGCLGLSQKQDSINLWYFDHPFLSFKLLYFTLKPSTLDLLVLILRSFSVI